ncbi:MAG: hypothetical protein DMD89_23245 [Candidatus Rokuibacteriota bacterium]|nr:MAG: hypothetical protein DMD89_23245 [Candidatus Rokubacteria bacterium]
MMARRTVVAIAAALLFMAAANAVTWANHGDEVWTAEYWLSAYDDGERSIGKVVAATYTMAFYQGYLAGHVEGDTRPANCLVGQSPNALAASVAADIRKMNRVERQEPVSVLFLIKLTECRPKR